MTQVMTSSPSNEEMKYWASLDTLAAEKTQANFEAVLDIERKDRKERLGDIEKWLDEYKLSLKIKSNGTTFEKWSKRFFYDLYEWYEMPAQSVPKGFMEIMYNNDATPDCAALAYAEAHGWETEMDKKKKQQRDVADTWMVLMRRADEIHQERLENVQWMPEKKDK